MNLSLERPNTCYDEWQKYVRRNLADKHSELAEIDPTYIRLKEEYPRDFEKKWDNAEDRIRIWAREWRKTDLTAEIKALKEELIAGLPSNDPVRGIVAIVDHKSLNKEMEELQNTEKAICEKLGETLTTAILKDFHQKGKNDRLMEIAIAPDSVKKMKKYITEGLENSGSFRTKATATKMLSDLNGLKLKAIGYIRDGEIRERQAGKAAEPDRKVAPTEKKLVVGRAM